LGRYFPHRYICAISRFICFYPVFVYAYHFSPPSLWWALYPAVHGQATPSAAGPFFAALTYEYQETRGREHPKKFLQGFKGYLHTDGHEAYHKLPAEIIVVGCWFHARQYWEKLLKATTKNKRTGTIAAQGLAYIEKLFALERAWKNLTPEERLKERLAKSKPVSNAFFVWVQSIVALPKSLLGKAVHYALSQRKYLENVYLDGRLELSNNRAERSVKPFVIGRKNWLFAATKDGARASSIIYSIVETAKENGLRPFQYMQFLLEALPNSTTGNLEALLPWSDKLPVECYIST